MLMHENIMYLSEIAKDYPLVFYAIRKAIGFAVEGLELVNTSGIGKFRKSWI